jgi:hypothetical protein
MSLPTRRAVLRAGLSCSLVATAGCLGGTGTAGTSNGESPETTVDERSEGATATEACSATDQPAPVGDVGPEAYPERPDRLTVASVREFVEAYERVYQYATLYSEVRYPERISVALDVSALETDDSRFRVEVGGFVNLERYVPEDGRTDETQSTLTPTPLGSSHRNVDTTYVVTDRRLERDGTAFECW